jgi:phosphoglycolate phosphatase
MPARAVLFDLDGTLLDTLDEIGASMNEVLGRLGLPGHGMDRYRVFVGDGIETLAHRVLPEDRRTPEVLAAAVADMKRTYAKRWERGSRPFGGIPGLLDELAARGLRLAVYSNKPHEFTVLMVQRMLPRWRFEVVYGAQPDLPRKPDPAGALRIAREMGLEPADFLYCGDTDTDMRTAVAAEMVPVGVLWGFRDEDELRANGARVVIREPRELLDLLDSGGPRPNPDA